MPGVVSPRLPPPGHRFPFTPAPRYASATTVGSTAARSPSWLPKWELDCLLTGVALEDLINAPFGCQEG